MKRESFRKRFMQIAALGMLVAASGVMAAEETPRPPNVVIIFLDDAGFGDFRPFGETAYPTPHVEQLAREGRCFSNFHVPQAICSASRAALMTGCYPGRTKVFGAHPPRAKGLDPKWTTMGQLLKGVGYATAVFGKWHLGDLPETRPPARGFDESCGLMYSNDMWRFHPSSRRFDNCPLQFWENGKIAIEDVTGTQQKLLTTWFTEHAVDFIKRHAYEPFFLYVPHSMPHVPIFCSDKFEGKSGQGLYADVMMEIDWSVGEITRALETAGVADDTLVIFSSDNGPWVSYGNHAGVTPYREAKATGFDGGTRSPCIMKWPKRIAAGSRSDRMFCSIDLFPTIAALAGAELPAHEIDGKDIWDVVCGQPGSVNPHEYYGFSTVGTFEGIITGDGKWRLHLPHGYRTLVTPGKDGKPGRYARKEIALSLFDMENDPYETTNVIDAYPEEAKRLEALARAHQQRFFSK